MSYTNTNIVRNHIEFVQPIQKNISDQSMVFSDNEYHYFFKGQIITDSVSVKSLKEYKQKQKALLSTAGDNIISSAPIVQGSVLCTSNNSLSKIYNENVDYILNYSTGTVSFPDTGTISDNQEVMFFYLPYHKYQENRDYKIKYDIGKIALTESSDIRFGEHVLIDYQPTSAFHSENTIENAVIEANAIIELTVDPSKEFGADLVLQTAATYRALEILCRSSAVKELASRAGRDNSAEAWITLGKVYLERSAELIRSFKEPVNQISIPTHS